MSIGLPAPSGRDLPKASIKLDLGADVEGASMLLERPGTGTSLWNPLQLHWHAPSEHTLDGELYLAEMHIVHTPMNGVGADGESYETATEHPSDLAVLGVWFEEDDCTRDDDDEAAACQAKLDASNAFFSSMGVFDESFRPETFLNTVSNVPIQAFIDSLVLGNFYSYDGGLTTPPCTEGVNWTMLEDAVPVSAEVSARIQKYYNNNPDFAPGCDGCSGGNNRVTMPIAGRTIFFNNGAIESAAFAAVTLGALTTLIM